MTSKTFKNRRDNLTRNSKYQNLGSPSYKGSSLDISGAKFSKSEARKGLKSAKPNNRTNFNQNKFRHNKSVGLRVGSRTTQKEKIGNYPVFFILK